MDDEVHSMELHVWHFFFTCLAGVQAEIPVCEAEAARESAVKEGEVKSSCMNFVSLFFLRVGWLFDRLMEWLGSG